MHKVSPFVLALYCSTAAVAVELTRPVSPLDTLETLTGDVEIHTGDQVVVVALRAPDAAGDRLFIVETDGPAELPTSLHIDFAEVLFWKGHLVVTAPRERKALHFSIPGVEMQPVATLEPSRPRATPEPMQLDTALRARYELTRIDTVTALISRGGPRAFLPLESGELKVGQREESPINPGGPGGVGTCGKSCTITCGDGSTCSTSCGENRCASCSCPASCSCS